MLKNETAMAVSAETPATYEPTLTDVARFIAAADSENSFPDTPYLMHWLVAHLPEFRELWRAAHEVRRQGVALLDLVRLQHCLVDASASNKACDTAFWLLRQVPRTRELIDQLTLVSQAGSNAQHPGATHQPSYQPSPVNPRLSGVTQPPTESALGHFTPELGHEGPHPIPGVALDRRLQELEAKLEELLENRNQMTTTNSEPVRSPSGELLNQPKAP